MTIAKGRVSIFTSPVLPNRIYANFVAKTRLHTLCPLIGEIEKSPPGWPAGEVIHSKSTGSKERIRVVR
jgi:hypothetical protein